MFQTTNQTSYLMPSGIFWDTRTHLPSSHLSHTMKAHINAKLSCAKLESKQRTSEFGDRCSCEVYLLMGFLGSCSHLGETIIYLIYTSYIYIYLMIYIYIYHLIYTYIWTMYRAISISHQKIIHQQGFMAHSPVFCPLPFGSPSRWRPGCPPRHRWWRASSWRNLDWIKWEPHISGLWDAIVMFVVIRWLFSG